MGRPKKEEAIEASGQSVFNVFDSKGDFVREYSVKDSGEDAEEMARVFAEELNGSIK